MAATIAAATAATAAGEGGNVFRDTQDQTNLLSKKRIIVIFLALAMTLFISTVDQTSVSTSLPVIGKDLDAVSTISWVSYTCASSTNYYSSNIFLGKFTEYDHEYR
jgi:hypothetical protein